MASGSDPKMADTGNDIMTAGVAFQVVTMAVCGLLAVDFAVRYRKSRVRSGGGSWSWGSVMSSRRNMFCVSSGFAYTVVLVRCIYRLPEMAGGWGGELIRHEGEVLVLDGL